MAQCLCKDRSYFELRDAQPDAVTKNVQEDATGTSKREAHASLGSYPPGPVLAGLRR